MWGVAFANILRGVPIDADGNYTGTLFTLLNPFGLLGGLATVALFCTYGAIFVALKTVGTDPGGRALAGRAHRHRRGAARRDLPAVDAAGPRRRGSRWCFAVLTAVALVAGLVANAQEREGWAFGLSAAGIVGVVATLFVALYPDVMPSSTNPAFSLTIDNASSTPSTLGHDVLGRAGHAAVRARLPGVDLLGLPQAHRAPQHPEQPAARRRHAAGTVTRDRRHGRRGHARSIRGCCATAGPAEKFLLVCVLLGLASAAAVLGQAVVLATAITAVFREGADLAAIGPELALLAGIVGLRAVLAYAQETAAARASAAVKSQLRTALLRRIVALGPSFLAGRRSGELAQLATRGVDAVDPTSPATCPSWCSPAWCHRCSWSSSGSPTGSPG